MSPPRRAAYPVSPILTLKEGYVRRRHLIGLGSIGLDLIILDWVRLNWIGCRSSRRLLMAPDGSHTQKDDWFSSRPSFSPQSRHQIVCFSIPQIPHCKLLVLWYHR